MYIFVHKTTTASALDRPGGGNNKQQTNKQTTNKHHTNNTHARMLTASLYVLLSAVDGLLVLSSLLYFSLLLCVVGVLNMTPR